MKLRTLLFAVLAAAATAAQAADLSSSVILVAKPELVDPLHGSAVLVVTPVGGDQHAGFIVNRPTSTTLGQLFPEDGPSQKVVDPVYLGGPLNSQVGLRARRAQAEPGRPVLRAHAGPLCRGRRGDGRSHHPRRIRQRALRRRPGRLAARRAARRDRERRVVRARPRCAPGDAQAEPGLWEELVRVSKLRANSI